MEQIMMNDREIKNKIILMCSEMFVARGIIHADSKQNVYKELLQSESDNIYKIKIFPPVKDEKKINEAKEHKHYVIKLFREKLTAISKTSGMVDFLNEHKDFYKFLILKDAGQKVINQIIEYPNTELLYEQEMLSNVLDYELQPKFEPLDKDNKEEIGKFLKEYYVNRSQIEKIDEDSAVSRFLGYKTGQILRIIRPSEVSGKSPAYRIVIASNQAKK
jgi:DNA-directed RNA polymerase subunit H (RpoH/RPB5)